MRTLSSATPRALPATQALRDATAATHAALEARLPLLSPSFSRADYAATVARLLRLYVPLEAAIDAHTDALAARGLSWPPRRKVAALRRDLAALDGAPTQPGAAPTPTHAAALLTHLAALDGVLGCLYVVEGATLGGRLLAAHFARHLGVTPTTGGAYFSSYGAARARMWREMCAVLDAELRAPAARDRALRGARAAFTALGAALGADVGAELGAERGVGLAGDA